MDQTQDLSGSRLAHAWAELQAHASEATPLDLSAWHACTLAARNRLMAQDDLSTHLLGFVAKNR